MAQLFGGLSSTLLVMPPCFSTLCISHALTLSYSHWFRAISIVRHIHPVTLCPTPSYFCEESSSLSSIHHLVSIQHRFAPLCHHQEVNFDDGFFVDIFRHPTDHTSFASSISFVVTFTALISPLAAAFYLTLFFTLRVFIIGVPKPPKKRRKYFI